MTYGMPISETDRINRHISLYGEMPPSTRIGRNQMLAPQVTEENMNLIILTAGVCGTWIFFELILPYLMDK